MCVCVCVFAGLCVCVCACCFSFLLVCTTLPLPLLLQPPSLYFMRPRAGCCAGSCYSAIYKPLSALMSLGLIALLSAHYMEYLRGSGQQQQQANPGPNQRDTVIRPRLFTALRWKTGGMLIQCSAFQPRAQLGSGELDLSFQPKKKRKGKKKQTSGTTVAAERWA